VEVAPPKAHEVRIKVKLFFYLSLGLKTSEMALEAHVVEHLPSKHDSLN
jgi:hypothetical protein